jgi:glycosyltransferase involved in cell wall biosynthesis
MGGHREGDDPRLPAGPRVRLRIGIDARAAAEVPAGRGRVVRELLRALAARGDPHAYLLYARRRWDEGDLDDRFQWRLSPLPDPWWHVRTAIAVNRESDVFLSTNSYLTAWFTRVPTTVVVFDMIAFQPGAVAQQRAARIERATIRPGLARSRQIVCNAEATRRDLVARFPWAESKLAVVPLAAGKLFREPRSATDLKRVQRAYGLDRPFVLTTGTLEPRKNLLRLIEAFSELPRELGHYTLIHTGPRGWNDEPILERARREGGRVRLLGLVSDEDLAALYRLCDVFCYPSLYEGFGLPVLEAMQAGAAVITSCVSSLPEVGGDAVLYVDPWKTGEIQGALENLLRSREEREGLGSRARRRGAEFSWERTATEILRVLAPTWAEEVAV